MFLSRHKVPWALSVLLGLLVTANGQIDDTFKNLQVYPEDIEREELIDTMREFTRSLGVRCTHCHVGGADGQFSSMIFEADDLETKQVARVMIRMARQINATLKSQTGRDPADLTTVTCFTCHHANTTPERLRDILSNEYDSGGADAVLGLYGDLRRQYYGRAVYDFSNSLLIDLAGAIAEQHGDTPGAIALLKANLKLYPKSHFTHYTLGQLLANAGDSRAAIRSLRKAVRLNPENNRYKNALKAVQEG